MDMKMMRSMLKLVNNPNATEAQLNAALKWLQDDLDAQAERNRLNPPPPLPTQEERLADARRRANANLAKRRR